MSLTAGQSLGYYAPAALGTTWMTAGAAVYRGTGAALSFYLDATASLPAMRCKIATDGTMEIDRWDTSAWTNIGVSGGWGTSGGPTTVPAGAWHYVTVACCYTNSAPTGYVIVYLDGVAMIVVNPIQMNTSGGVSLTGFRLGVDTGTVYFDDVYAANQKGLNSSQDLVPVQITTAMPAGAGDLTQLTLAGAATNWQAVSPAAPPSGTWTNYVYGPADGLADLYTTGNPIPSGKTVYAFAMRWWAQASDSTPCGFAPVYKLAGLSPNPYAGAPQILGVTPGYYASPIYTSLPGGYTALTPTNINALQIGLAAARPTASPNPLAATQYLYLPSTLLTHTNGTQYSVRVTAIAPFGGVAADAASVCTSFSVLDNGFAQAAQLLMEVLRTL